MYQSLNDVFIVSVEDAYGCKRPVSVPGILVNVRRIKVRNCAYLAKTLLDGHFLTSLPFDFTGKKGSAKQLSTIMNKLACPCASQERG